ncbi:MAG: hypothetical protein V7K86_05490 [Nostoc sp.]|uniref:hypothetical protein n=1 Tax=Nostoc sp. TaxID=1180 RepID=UPI002FFB55E8
MGVLWEEIADISPYVIIPEFEFGVKIIAFPKLVRYTRRGTAVPCPYTLRYNVVPHLNGNSYTGIDIIIFSEETVKFAQLKTLKGTLTGSQAPRSKKELSIHQNPLFIAAFNLGDWTFKDNKIPRIAGKEFWNNIHIDYDLVENHVRNMLQRVDNDFAELATS